VSLSDFSTELFLLRTPAWLRWPGARFLNLFATGAHGSGPPAVVRAGPWTVGAYLGGRTQPRANGIRAAAQRVQADALTLLEERAGGRYDLVFATLPRSATQSMRASMCGVTMSRSWSRRDCSDVTGPS
jgi:hypothetical protein